MNKSDPPVGFFKSAIGRPLYLNPETGEVWSSWAKRLLHPAKDAGGHLILYADGKTQKLHKLMLVTFIGPRPPGMVCRHLNGDALDNRIANLAWGTVQENNQDTVRHGRHRNNLLGRHGEDVGCAKLTERQVKNIRNACQAGVFHKLIAECYGVSKTTVDHISRGVAWKHLWKGETVHATNLNVVPMPPGS